MIKSKGFVVEAWFHNTEAEFVFDPICRSLTAAGFVGVEKLTPQTCSYHCITLCDREVFFAFNNMSEKHLDVKIKAHISWDDGYSAFEQLFIHLLDRYCQNVQLAELLLSTRNSHPYPFLTHSFYQGAITIIDVVAQKILKASDDGYWANQGPQLHFISSEVFARTQVAVDNFARNLSSEIIYVKDGVILDCGWTNEFPLPPFSSISAF